MVSVNVIRLLAVMKHGVLNKECTMRNSRRSDTPAMVGRRKRSRETFTGVLVLALSIGVISYIHSTSLSGVDRRENSYELNAYFDRSDGLAVNGEVRVAGVPVGKVVAQTLSKYYQARVTLHIDADITLPDDSVAVVHSSSLLGPKFIEILPGGSERIIPPLGEIRYTQGAIPIDNLLEHILSRAKVRRV